MIATAKTRGISSVGLTIIVILVLLFLAGLGYATTLPPPVQTQIQSSAESTSTNLPSSAPSSATTTPPASSPPAKTSVDLTSPTSLKITVRDDKTPWAFIVNEKSNPTIQLKKGEKVIITMKNTGAIPHDFIVEELKAAYIPPDHTPGGAEGQTLDPGKEVQIIIAPDDVGTFTYFCSVPGHKDLGMAGKIVIQ